MTREETKENYQFSRMVEKFKHALMEETSNSFNNNKNSNNMKQANILRFGPGDEEDDAVQEEEK